MYHFGVGPGRSVSIKSLYFFFFIILLYAIVSIIQFLRAHQPEQHAKGRSRLESTR
jgi:hypothetical protein